MSEQKFVYIKIAYKTGNVQYLKCDSFNVERISAELSKLSWENAEPKPLFVGLDDIESIFEVTKKEFNKNKY
jgi:hypothetical protein